MTINQIKDQDIVECIENCALDNKYWFDKKLISEQLHVSIDIIQDIVKNSNNIVINAEGALTTRKLYKQKTPFFNKLLDSIKNKID